MIELRRHIRDIPDFPKPGIVFRDITPLLADRDAFRALVDRFVERYRGRADVVLGIESRGFLIGAAVAYGIGTGIALVRKPGKLPSQTYTARELGALRSGLAATALLCVVELVGGYLTNSLALVSDAAHMFTDMAALGLTLFALWICSRPASETKTFGYYRAEILAALVNGVV